MERRVTSCLRLLVSSFSEAHCFLFTFAVLLVLRWPRVSPLVGMDSSACSIPPVTHSHVPQGSLGCLGSLPPVAVSLAGIGTPAEERPITFSG